MIKSRLKLLIAQREINTGQRISYQSLGLEVGLSKNTLARLAETKTDRVEFTTLDKLCAYFNCTIGDLLEYVPDEKPTAKQSRQAK
jgi:putative transcriptional regulator